MDASLLESAISYPKMLADLFEHYPRQLVEAEMKQLSEELQTRIRETLSQYRDEVLVDELVDDLLSAESWDEVQEITSPHLRLKKQVWAKIPERTRRLFTEWKKAASLVEAINQVATDSDYLEIFKTLGDDQLWLNAYREYAQPAKKFFIAKREQMLPQLASLPIDISSDERLIGRQIWFEGNYYCPPTTGIVKEDRGHGTLRVLGAKTAKGKLFHAKITSVRLLEETGI